VWISVVSSTARMAVDPSGVEGAPPAPPAPPTTTPAAAATGGGGGGGGGMSLLRAVKAGATTRVNNTVSADPDLVLSAVPAGNYQLFGQFFYTTNTTPSFQGSILASQALSSADSWYTLMRLSGGITAPVITSPRSATETTAVGTNFFTETTNDNVVMLWGTLVIPSATDISFQWAQWVTTGGTNTILKAGSYIALLSV